MKFLQTAKHNPFLSTSFFIFFIRFFPTLANLLVVIYYSRGLDVALYGTYTNFWVNLNLLYPLACLGIQVLIFTYPPQQVVNIAKRIAALKYAGYGLWLLAIGLAFGLLQIRSLHTLVVPFLYVLVFSLTIISEAYLIICKRFGLLIVSSIVYSAVFWSVHRYVFGLHFSLQYLFTALLVLGGIRLAVYVVAMIGTFKKEEVSAPNALQDLGKIRSLWLHLALFDIIQNYSNWIDKFIVAHTLDSRASGIYYNGSLNIPFLPLLLSAAFSATLIQLSRTDDADETAHVLKLVNQTGRMLSAFVFPLFFFLLFFRYEVVVSLLSGKYIPAVPVFMAALFILPARACSYTSVLQRKHRGDVINKGAIGEIVIGCLLIYPLYQWLGLPGVALSFVISTYLQAGYYLHQAATILQVSWLRLIPLSNWVIKIIIFALLFFILHFVTSYYFTNVIAVISGSVFTMVAILCSLWIEIKNAKETNGK